MKNVKLFLVAFAMLCFIVFYACKPGGEEAIEEETTEEVVEEELVEEVVEEELIVVEEEATEEELEEDTEKVITSLKNTDRILERMGFGNIAFNAPRSMNLYDTELIQLFLSLDKSIDELKQMIKAEGEKEGANIQISNRMVAHLSGPNFQITAITPKEQAIISSDVTEWKWDIKPKEIGLQSLHLTLTALFTIDNDISTKRAIRTFDKTIEVQVTCGQRIKKFFSEYLEFLLGSIIIPIVFILRKRLKNLVLRIYNFVKKL